MIHVEYLIKGLCGMSRASLVNPMTGHLGAALVAGYFFCQDHDLDPRVEAGIETELERILDGEESWFDPEEAGITVSELCAPLPEERSQPEQIETIAGALSKNIHGARESGHNVIFASIALRALGEHVRYATPSCIGGIRRLIENFDRLGPGAGYYGSERGWIAADQVVPAQAVDRSPYASEGAMAGVVLDELIRSAHERRRGLGGLYHVINHANALIELARSGYPDLAQRGYGAHRHHLQLYRTLPRLDDELGARTLARSDPRTLGFWSSGELARDSALLTHRIKTLYGFHSLIRLVDDATQREHAEAAFLYLV